MLQATAVTPEARVAVGREVVEARAARLAGAEERAPAYARRFLILFAE